MLQVRWAEDAKCLVIETATARYGMERNGHCFGYVQKWRPSYPVPGGWPPKFKVLD